VTAVLGPALVTLGALATLIVWLTTTSSGLRFAAGTATALVPGLSIRGVEGSLSAGARIAHFALEREAWALRADDVAFDVPQWTLAPARLDLARLAVRRLQIDWVAQPGAATEPDSLGLPFELVLRQVTVDELALGTRGATPTELRRIGFAGHMGRTGIAVERLAGEFERTRVQAHGRIDAAPPFSTLATLSLEATARDRAITAVAQASGSLRALGVDLAANDQATRLQARAIVRTFEAVMLERLQATFESFDPSLWFEAVPSMQLRGEVDLAPAAGAAGGWNVAGPFHVENLRAGPLDRALLPVRLLRGSLVWSAESLALDIARAEGVRGQADGTLRWSLPDRVDARLQFSGIDAATLHSRAVGTSLAGRLHYRLQSGEHFFEGRVRNTGRLALEADVDAAIRARVLEVAQAQLRLGGGRADVRGRLALDGTQDISLRGSFGELDLALLVPGIDTRLNGTLEADGQLQPSPRGRARFDLGASRVAARALAGRGNLRLAPDLFEADVELRSGEAWLTASGGLGGGRELAFDLAVPELEPLLPGFGGRLDAKATLSGPLDALRLQMTAGAKNLRLPGGHRIASAMLEARGGAAPPEPLAIVTRLSGHVSPAGPASSLAGLELVARGTTANANIELTGVTETRQPLRLLASGGIAEGAWRGAIRAAEAGAPLDLLMRSPAPLRVAPSGVAFGPADFELRGAQLSAVGFEWSAGRWKSAGQFRDMQPQALDARARAPRRVVRSGSGDRVPLTLAGRWELEQGQTLNGIAVIERTGGDLYSGVDALSPIGVSDIGAALNVIDNRVTGNVYMRGRALGRIDALIDAYLDPADAGGRLLAQDRPFRVVADADLPDLSWLGPLIGDNVQFGGRATLQAEIGGTPADPSSKGTLRGEAMRLAWVDQAVRLENGRLDAVLDDGVLVINEWHFAGTPRVAPRNRRALEGLHTDQPFEVRAVGRFALRTLAGSIGITAAQLPVLQREDRWMVVSGSGGVTLSPQRADLYAKLTVDGAYINFDNLRAGRSLPGDVVVKRASDPRQAQARAPLDVVVDLQGDLGRRFYIEGAGIEARLAGAVAVTGRPDRLRAEGSVRTVDGVFAGYGQRLQIERGIVTFNGAVDNPALNVLAIRAGLPVEVGVAIGGTAQRPLVRLHSDPVMSESEKLSWLVLGRQPGVSDGNDRAMLSAAASALFAGQVDSASAGLMRSLGIDQITLQPGQSSGSLLPRETVAGRLRSSGVSTSSSAAADFLAVGKRINDDLFLSFEQALTGAEYFVALNYRLTRQLSLIARAGSTNALDLVYSIAFD
jgi:translocation and assembly module TamB